MPTPTAGAVPAPAATASATRPRAQRASAADLLRIGTGAGLLAGLPFAAHLMAIAEIAASPTTRAGVRSSAWTPLTGIASYAWGPGALHGGLWPGYIALGLAIHLAMSALVGVLGAWWIHACVGTDGLPWLSIGLGIAYGTLVEVVAMHLVVNPTQTPDVVYNSLPPWAWWTGHWVYGALLGLLATRRLERLA